MCIFWSKPLELAEVDLTQSASTLTCPSDVGTGSYHVEYQTKGPCSGAEIGRRQFDGVRAARRASERSNPTTTLNFLDTRIAHASDIDSIDGFRCQFGVLSEGLAQTGTNSASVTKEYSLVPAYFLYLILLLKSYNSTQ